MVSNETPSGPAHYLSDALDVDDALRRGWRQVDHLHTRQHQVKTDNILMVEFIGYALPTGVN